MLQSSKTICRRHFLEAGASFVAMGLGWVPLAAANDNYVGRSPEPTPGAGSTGANDNEVLPSPEDFSSRISWSVGVWETNRGGDYPIPRESALDTVAGLHASLKTIDQATMPYVINEVAQNTALANLAVPAMTPIDLRQASTCCESVSRLLIEVAASYASGVHIGNFVAQSGKEIRATFLGEDDVVRMFAAVGLKRKLDELHRQVASGKVTLETAVDSLTDTQRLGLGRSSLKNYIQMPRNWGENHVAWQRKAVLAMPGDIGRRLEAIAVSGNGTAVARAVTGRRVRAEIKENARATEKAIVINVAQQNNPGEPKYGEHVFAVYERLYLKNVRK